jgi:hypothetical protein
MQTTELRQGRPPLPTDLKRRNTIALRLTDSEYEDLRSKAAALRMPTSLYVRLLVFQSDAK